MAFQCEPQHAFGYDYCITRCPSIATGVFELVRVERAADRPPADPRAIDVAVLDMNHGWPNVGHDAIVMAIQTIACDAREALLASRLRVRAISYDVRRGGAIPPAPDARDGGIYVGTGGPGHLDPRQNDGISPGSQGIHENPAWEAPLFALFDEIHGNSAAALLGVCHTFGVMCRWLGVAEPVLRGPDKGGKSAGIVENVLTWEARTHGWFRHLAEEAHGDRISILDNRLYDLIPTGAWRDAQALSYEVGPAAGGVGESLTMMQVEPGGVMPRILAVNHHPEVVNRARLLTLLWQKRARGEVSHAWYEERAETMTQTLRDESSDRGLDLTSRYTFFEPLRFHIYQHVRRRAAALGEATDLDEAAVLDWAAASRAARL